MPSWRERIEGLRQDTYAAYLAARDPRTPWYAKALALVVLAYALSPIDLIPDFVPVLGHLDDLILVPLGLWIVIKLVPQSLLTDARASAAQAMVSANMRRKMAIVVVLTWALLLAITAAFALHINR